MAKNIDFMGATFPDVPSIRLPQHEGGLVSFTDVTDTTAIASDVASGKYFYTADGEKTVGTASGGITPSGTISITQNGTVDVTQYASADVNVSGGGGGSSYTLVHESEHVLSLSTGSTILGTFYIPNIFTSEKIIYICARRKEGKPTRGFYGADTFIVSPIPKNNYTDDITSYSGFTYIVASTGIWTMSQIRSGSTAGIYPTKITANDNITLAAGYNSSRSGVIDGTYVVQVYLIDWPNDASPFDAV